MQFHPLGTIRFAAVICGVAAAITFAGMLGVPSASVHAQEPAPGSIDGKKIYVGKCSTCHGEDGKISDLGKALGSKDLRSAEVQQLTDDQMRQMISDGKGNMPAYKTNLSGDEISATIKYLRTLKMDDGSAK